MLLKMNNKPAIILAAMLLCCATLATGGNAPQHGLSANDWFDAAQRRVVYCMEEPDHPELGGSAGRSPRNLTSSTFGDELVLASGGRSRVFSVSLKDRNAIILGGRLGKAYWYTATSGWFVTSSYYHDTLPEWVEAWNATRPADRYAAEPWRLLQDPAAYAFAGQDERGYERPTGTLGRSFPHPLANPDPAIYYTSLKETPLADQLTLEFVRALVAAAKPGRQGATDVLAISFSATDYVGHAFGPDSLEAEDNLLRLDRNLALAFQVPGIYLDRAAIGRLDLEVAAVERAVAEEIVGIPGFALAFTRSDLLAGRHPASPEAARVAAAFHPDRSGNVIVVPDPYWYLDQEPFGNAAMHGSPYRYDTHVPLMFAGPGIGQGLGHREVAPRDLAPADAQHLPRHRPAIGFGRSAAG
jgi:hypothetical protein